LEPDINIVGEASDGGRAVAERAGFTIEGVLRARLTHRGQRVDAWVGSLLRAEAT
jgi:RimJ/RimL family protein N-acetyltransferase